MLILVFCRYSFVVSFFLLFVEFNCIGSRRILWRMAGLLGPFKRCYSLQVKLIVHSQSVEYVPHIDFFVGTPNMGGHTICTAYWVLVLHFLIMKCPPEVLPRNKGKSSPSRGGKRNEVFTKKYFATKSRVLYLFGRRRKWKVMGRCSQKLNGSSR